MIFESQKIFLPLAFVNKNLAKYLSVFIFTNYLKFALKIKLYSGILMLIVFTFIVLFHFEKFITLSNELYYLISSKSETNYNKKGRVKMRKNKNIWKLNNYYFYKNKNKFKPCISINCIYIR